MDFASTVEHAREEYEQKLLRIKAEALRLKMLLNRQMPEAQRKYFNKRQREWHMRTAIQYAMDGNSDLAIECLKAALPEGGK